MIGLLLKFFEREGCHFVAPVATLSTIADWRFLDKHFAQRSKLAMFVII